MNDTDSYEHDNLSSSATGSPAPGSTWRHPVNVGHLVMGLAFLGLVAVWALVAGEVGG